MKDLGQRLGASAGNNSLVSRLGRNVRKEVLNYVLCSHGIPVPNAQHTESVEIYLDGAFKKVYRTVLGLIPSQASFLYFPK